MKHIRRKITLAVLGTMLLVFAALFATVNIFIPRYLTTEAQKAILSEDEHESPVPFSDIKNENDEQEHFLTPSVRYLEIEGEIFEPEYLSKSEQRLREYCRREKPSVGEFHTFKNGGSRFVFRMTQVEADGDDDAYSYILYVDIGAVMQYASYLNAAFSRCWLF